MKKIRLNNVEFEALLLYLFVSVSMAIRGVVILRTSAESIEASSFYALMDSIMPYSIWGYVLLLASLLVLIAPISQTTRRYYLLIAGNLLGGLICLAMASIGFIESHQSFTPLQIGSIAFFNIVLVLHGGKCIWSGKKEIHMLQELNLTKQKQE